MSAARSPRPATARRPSLRSTVRATNGETGTNVQEAGVDEPDVVKIDGDMLFRIQDDVLTTYDVAGDEPRQLLGPVAARHPQRRDPRVRRPGRSRSATTSATTRQPAARVVVLDVSRSRRRRPWSRRPTTPARSARPACTATSSGVVLDNGLPRSTSAPPTATWRARGARRQPALVRADDARRLAADGRRRGRWSAATTSRSRPRTPALGTTTVVAFEAARRRAHGHRGRDAPRTSYFSTDRLYLAISASPTAWWSPIGSVIDCFDRCSPEPDGRRQHRAAAPSPSTAPPRRTSPPAASRAQIADRWSMDYADGALRVALGATNETGNVNSV